MLLVVFLGWLWLGLGTPPWDLAATSKRGKSWTGAKREEGGWVAGRGRFPSGIWMLPHWFLSLRDQLEGDWGLSELSGVFGTQGGSLVGFGGLCKPAGVFENRTVSLQGFGIL